MKLAEHHQVLCNELAHHGIKPQVEPTHGGHVRFRWNANGHAQGMTVQKHAGDWRAIKNNLAKVRRLLRTAGLAEEPAPPPPVPAEAPSPLRALEDRIALLERDVRLLLDRLTEPAPEPPPPEPPPPTHVVCEAPKKKRRGLGDYSWLWRVMRYDDYLNYKEIAKETGRTDTNISVTLCNLKKRGLVQHKPREGWRKDRSVETLGRDNGHMNGSMRH